MKRVKIYSTLLIFTLIVFNCKKYPEGGYEKRGPKNIIGDWKLELYEVNGIDSTDLINYMGDDKYKKVLISKNASTFSVSYEGFKSKSSSFADKNSSIIFYSTETGLKCTLYNNINYCYRSFLTPEVKTGDSFTKWEVLKLTNKELVLKCFLTNNYKIKLVK